MIGSAVPKLSYYYSLAGCRGRDILYVTCFPTIICLGAPPHYSKGKGKGKGKGELSIIIGEGVTIAGAGARGFNLKETPPTIVPTPHTPTPNTISPGPLLFYLWGFCRIWCTGRVCFNRHTFPPLHLHIHTLCMQMQGALETIAPLCIHMHTPYNNLFGATEPWDNNLFGATEPLHAYLVGQ